MGLMSFTASISYNIFNSWSLIFFTVSVAGRDDRFRHCTNEWNTPFVCMQSMDNTNCWEKDNSKRFNVTGCVLAELLPTSIEYETPSEQYFYYLVGHNREGLFHVTPLSKAVLGGLATSWILTCIFVCRGLHSLGRANLVAVFASIALLIVLMCTALQQEGGMNGLRFLFSVNFEKWSDVQSWYDALSQCCFSLSIGMGGLHHLSSFRPRSNDAFRDALIITGADTLVSLLAGVVTFAVLGTLQEDYSRDSAQSISNIVSLGPDIVYAVYPEALSRLTLAGLWCALFFLMLFLLGMTSLTVMFKTAVSCLIDRFEVCARHRYRTIIGLALLGFILGIPLCGDAGTEWIMIMDRSINVFCLISVVICEFVVLHIYGPMRFYRDVRASMARPVNVVGWVVGPYGAYVRYTHVVVGPVPAVIIFAFAFTTMIQPNSGPVPTMRRFNNTLSIARFNARSEFWATHGISLRNAKAEMKALESTNHTRFELLSKEMRKAEMAAIAPIHSNVDRNARKRELRTANAIAWIGGILPLLLIPLGALASYVSFRARGKGIRDLFRPNTMHPSVRYTVPEAAGSWIKLFGIEPIALKTEAATPVKTRASPVPKGRKGKA